MKPVVTRLDVDTKDLCALLERARQALSDEDYQKLKAAIDTLGYLTQLLERKNMSIQRLRQILFGASTEKTSKVLKNKPDEHDAPSQQDRSASESTPGAQQPSPTASDEPIKPRAGHGRNGAQDYPGATKVELEHPSLSSGDRCPECQLGKVYEIPPGRLVRITGHAPLQATVYELEKLRCNLCGEVFTAPEPAGLSEPKYDVRAASMIALLKYGTGLPFHRLQGLQASLGIPLPASTQWEIVQPTGAMINPAFVELIRQAAQNDVVYNDDTTAKIQALMAERAKSEASASSGESVEQQRTGIFTSGIVATSQHNRIALFFTGAQHAGENLAKVLALRAAELDAPIQMCDALSRNLPQAFKTILAHCNSHARRKFVEVAPNFPDQCTFVLELLAKVYRNDALCKQQLLSPQARLQLHQAESAPLMQQLRDWLDEQLEQHLVEPNSGLGQAITYMRKHWEKLTLFLRQAGAPLDNNICERALKMAILHRRNSLFYKTQKGAYVGDLFMSLIHTCQLCGANPFEYLTALQEHHTELANAPPQWMPWNYRETMMRLGLASSVGDSAPQSRLQHRACASA
jgi:transposase